ncbi:MAG: hypothetical protein MUP98_16115 [Candidatus Aminicenantes bacterium]|nr:hypothetical protein [Candidatus Aminicenantes bacterium]
MSQHHSKVRILPLLGLLIIIFSGLCSSMAGTENQSLLQKHSRLYRNSAVMDISGILGLGKYNQGILKEVTVHYNMILSDLEADWLLNGRVVGHSRIQKGMTRTVRFAYNAPLAEKFSLRFTGPRGQIQVTQIAALLDTGSVSGSDDSAKRRMLEQMIKLDAGMKPGDRKLATAVKFRLIAIIMQENLLENSAIQQNLSQNKSLQIESEKGNIVLSGEVAGIMDKEIFSSQIQREITQVPGVRRVRQDVFILVPPILHFQSLVDFTIEKAVYSNGNLLVTVRNNGTKDFAQPPLENYSMRLQWLKPDGEPVGTSPVLGADNRNNPIPAGSTADYLLTADFGNYFFYNPTYYTEGGVKYATILQVKVDSQDHIKELNENNNTFRITVQRPDLTLYHGSPKVLRPDLLKFTLANIGQRELTEGVEIELQWMDPSGNPVGAPFTQVFSDNLKAGRYNGSSIAGTGAWKVFSSENYPAVSGFIRSQPAQASQLQVTLDPGDNIPELNETNNVEMIPATGGGIDLTVTNAIYTDGSLKVTVSNAGTSDFAEPNAQSFSMRLNWLKPNGEIAGISPVLGESSLYHPIPAGGAAELLFNADFGGYFFYNPTSYTDSGIKYAAALKVNIDIHNQIMESDENNNSYTIQGLRPDLIIYDGSPKILRPDLVKFTLANIGQRTVPEEVEIELQWIDSTGGAAGAALLHKYRDGLEAGRYNGSSIAGTGSWIVLNSQDYPQTDQYIRNRPARAAKLRITIDPRAKIPELNESNNREILAASSSGIDLTIERAVYSEGNIKVTVRNNGTIDFAEPAAQSFSLRLNWLKADGENAGISPVLGTESRSNSIPAGGAVEYLINADFGGYFFYNPTYYTDGGVKYAEILQVEVDVHNQIMEPDENNNTFNITEMRPDLIIYDGSPIIFRPDRLQFTFANIGQRPVTESVDIDLQWLSAAGDPIGSSFVYTYQDGLEAGRYNGSSIAGTGSWSVFSSETISAADLFIRNRPTQATGLRITIDPFHRIVELNKNNNIRIQ